ncbi:filamentous haemagglutinin family protein [Sphingobium sp. CFD-2]|uniref:filamentous haemagglutinin family protein n=1 Tax=Sphingobium sp. CFD-2 TaxID=2878542 RepID=UPI00214B6174|nr:filamentous haemagglutinin family protein [Sphingobium sp. CFD-2]
MIASSSLRPAFGRRFLFLGASLAAIATALPVEVQAQTLGAAVGKQTQVGTPRPQTTVPVRSGTMQGALQRQQTTQGRVDEIRAYITSIREAANRGPVVDGLDRNGLDPTDAIREAIAATRAGNTQRASELLVSAGAQYDITGLKSWQGAGLPSQTTGANGHVTVTIDQTQERALLSWNRFDIGANTTLQFNQKSNGTAQPGWVAVNRVTNATDPSLILGNMKADGTVVVLNRAGIIFGKDSQVNTHSLLASTLELGNAARFVAGSNTTLRAATIAERNLTFLEDGLFTAPDGTAFAKTGNDVSLLVSSDLDPTSGGTGGPTSFVDRPEGGIVVDAGARIGSGQGGYLLLAAPSIRTAGALSAIDGQVSLQAGRAVSFAQSSGAATSPDPNVRGYLFNSFVYDGSSNILVDRPANPSDGHIQVSGLIESRRGYLSLGTSAFGSIDLSGLLSTTTSVSRNGKITLFGGDITLHGNANPALASGIAMFADTNGETIPIGTPNEPAGFKRSQLEIGAQISAPGVPFGGLVPANVSIGQNAVIYAPGADVSVGRTTTNLVPALGRGSVLIAPNAIIDVSGLKDVKLDASRNSIEITPVKRNELRDTPNYREVEVDGNFSLNGKTIFIDPRLSGVREDGVAWVGSPLIEAASIAGQLPATAQELMTKGGSISLQGERVDVANGATVDISGGWVSYAAGALKTSKLVTSDGRVVDISRANANDVYVDVITSTTEVRQPRSGMLRNWMMGVGQGQKFDAAYDEGRDAGALTISAAAVTIDGAVHANAFAGARQIAKGDRPSVAPSGLGRGLQASTYELPAGGALSVQTLGDVLVYHGTRGTGAAYPAELLLSDSMLNLAGLAQLDIVAAGNVTFADIGAQNLQSPDALSITGKSHLILSPGGVLSVLAGRTIRFDGTVEAPSGSISARTVNGFEPSEEDFPIVFGAAGSIHRSDDDVATLYATDPGTLRPFDIIVTGKLSTAGQWVNDNNSQSGPRGGAWRDGGSISLRSARNVIAAVGDSLETATQAVDLSGSIRVSGTLDVSAGGYVTPTGSLILDGKGGDISLLNETVYASSKLTNTDPSSAIGLPADDPLYGANQSVEFTPRPSAGSGLSATLPHLVADPRSTVDISQASILGFGFAGGGTFKLVAPDVSFGSDTRAGSTHIGLDFFQRTGFGTLDVSSYRSRIVDDLFANDRVAKSAFLETTRFVVKKGETFDLTQWMLPTLLTADQSKALRGLETGSDLLTQSFLVPTTNVALWDRKAAHLVLGGLTELDVMAGGSIIGAPEASITIGKLYNAGNITLHGGSIRQRNDLSDSLIVGGFGVRDTDLGGNGLADAFGGTVDSQGRFLESAVSAADPRLTNGQLVSEVGADRIVHILGVLDAEQGIVLDRGSVTDLSGVALFDPRAVTVGGRILRSGRVVDGGTIALEAVRLINRVPGSGSASSGRTLVRDDQARLDISGAAATFEISNGRGGFSPWLEWSRGGSISALGGGSLGSTAIDARGGDIRAEGGTLEWLRPTVGTGSADQADYLPVGLIQGSDFDTLIARGSLTLDGDFDLSLRKALMVTSQDRTQSANIGSEAVSLGVTAGSNVRLASRYIRLASTYSVSTAGMGGDAASSLVLQGGLQGIDVVGGIAIGQIGSFELRTPGDVRFTGVYHPSTGQIANYSGQFSVVGDLTIDARRTYATTGTGNLQALLENTNGTIKTPYDIAVIGNHTIRFGNRYLDPAAPLPLTAGTHLRVLAARIVQDGFLAAPLGQLTLGSTSTVLLEGGDLRQVAPTETLTFGRGSVTSVSGAGLTVPYGTTTDGVEYYFPTVATPLTKLPVGELALSAGSIVQSEGALIDGRGGGDVYAYEFQSGIGGSRDVLDRFNRDAFSSNHYDPVTGTGYQFPDQRQVYALVPVSDAGKIAPYDPIYSADYGDLYGAQAGRSVHLEGGNGIAAGEYLLVPAKYAMAIPGALRLVENTGAASPLPGKSTKLLDGSIVLGGTFAFAGTDIAESTRHSFTVQTKDVFTKYSTIKTTPGSDYLTGLNPDARPRLPLDAARVVLAPLNELKVAGVFDLTAGEGGQAGQIDILGSNILIAAADAEAAEGMLLISDTTLAKLNAPSLLIGGRRTDNADGTTSIAATATNITVAGGASLQASELLLAVGGDGSALAIEDGATLTAVGDPGILTDADYKATGAGSILRLANGPERLVARTSSGTSTLDIGAASLTGEVLALDTSGNFVVAEGATLDARYAAISGADIRFAGGGDVAGEPGAIGTSLAAKLGAAERLTVRSPGSIRFAEGSYQFNDLVLDTASLAADAQAAAGSAVRIEAGNVRLANSGNAADGCVSSALCGSAGSLTLDATTISLGNNAVRAAGFTDSLTLAASDGLYVEGKGSFDTGGAGLTLNTPFIAERSAKADPRNQTVRPDYTFLSTGTVAISSTGANPEAKIEGNAAPGARIAFGTIDDRVQSLAISGTAIRATAGIIDVQSAGDVSLTGATLSVLGYEKVFGDEVDPVTVAAGGGTINLFSANGGITTDAASALITDTGKGNAGSLNLLAGNGAVTLLAALNPGLAVDPEAEGVDPDAKPVLRSGSFTLDSGTGSFDFGGFVERYGTQFGGDVWVRTGAGDLTLAEGQSLKAEKVTLTADGGSIGIAGTLDTSGVDVTGMTADAARNARVNGGDIALWGQNGVTLAATAKLDTHTKGYADTDSRPAKAGDVILGIGSESASLTIASGATIDVGARRTQAALVAGESGGRLIPKIVTDTVTGNAVTVYEYAAPDQGGDVIFRAPVIGTDRNKVALSQRGAIVGADSAQLEAFQRYDLDAMADSGFYSGITRDADGAILLDFGATGANPFTTDMALADGTSSLVRFIQDFDVSTVDGSSLDSMRLRPGVELASKGAIETVSQWNLAAATFSPEQLQAAVDAGVLELIPEISGGTPRYKVVPGKEGQLLDHHATFLYRTDGGSARGEAPVVTLRAGNDLTINRSISDGFFTFRDQSDPNYIDQQLGGGDRTYQPAIQFGCGNSSSTGVCGEIANYVVGGPRPTTNARINISLNLAAQKGNTSGGGGGAPMTLAGNAADAGGEDRNSLAFAELFPLLDGDVAMHSSDLRLVAGTGSTLSANPLVTDRASTADLKIRGEYSYDVTATAGAIGYGGALQFRLQRPTGFDAISVDIGDLLSGSDPDGGLGALDPNAYTFLNWGTGSSGLAADTRAAARAYFAGKGYSFIGSATNPSGIDAPLSEIVGFLQHFESRYVAGVVSGAYASDRSAPPLLAYEQPKAYVRSVVRSGDGRISAAAARDIDLRATTDTVYRDDKGIEFAAPNYGNLQEALQVGGSALYTAGIRVSPAAISARIVGGDTVSILPDSVYFTGAAEDPDFTVSPKSLSNIGPVLAHGGGNVEASAGRDILARRDVWSEYFLRTGGQLTGRRSTRDENLMGSPTQPWRVGTIGWDTEIGIAPQYFTSGIAALGGGDVSISAGRDIRELILALDTSITTTTTSVGAAMLTFGSGDLTVAAGHNIAAGRYDIATGRATVRAGQDITAFGIEPQAGSVAAPQHLRIRLTDAVVDVSAGGSATIASVSALGAGRDMASWGVNGFFSASGAFSLSANEDVATAPTGNLVYPDQRTSRGRHILDFGQSEPDVEFRYTQILPPSVSMTSLSGSVKLAEGVPHLLFPSSLGQLRIYSAGSVRNLAIAMSDADPSLMGGAWSDQRIQRVRFELPWVNALTSNAELRLQHNRRITHLGDPEPIRIHSGGDIDSSALFLPKQARVTAGGDIVDMYFIGQNIDAEDITRIRAGGDIKGTILGNSGTLPYVRSNNFVLGGPGSLIVEAGRNIGPFVTSANINQIEFNSDGSSAGTIAVTYAGGIRTVGNDLNPWLDRDGADLSVRFGMAGGANYAALRETYLNPANFAKLDGDLFEQVTDTLGNQRPDRTKPIYAPLLATWLRENQPEAFAAIFAGESFEDSASGQAALANAAYGKSGELYAAFAKIDLLRQQGFLIDQLYFNELAAPADPNGSSYLQYVRGYRAVNTLFSPERGYTDNLAPYTLDPSTVNEDHPLGVPVRNIVNGQPQAAERIVTGNADLRLATIQTARGGDISILAPGGDMIAGSVVRTSEQVARRYTAFTGYNPAGLQSLPTGNFARPESARIVSIPAGFEGVLTLEGGKIFSFTDGDFILNQSRVFSLANGDITMWSSNGDLAAGQGPKSASSFPPVTVRFDENGFTEVDSAGSVSGAGIGSFKRAPNDPPSNVVLIAPVGEVDAGDAGVRASGNIIVAAARVANADNFKASGDITGVPTTTATMAVATPQDAASSVAAQAAQAAQTNRQSDQRSLITVDVLGPASDGRCDPNTPGDPDCR